MTDSFAYSYLASEDDAPVPTANAPFRRLVHAFSNKAPLPNLARQEERELIARVQQDNDAEAMALLVEHHTGFITNIAREFALYNGMENSMDDLLSEGYQAFINAVHRYKRARQSARLNSFARYHVSGAILTYILKNRYAFTVGTSSGERVFLLKFSKFVAKFKEVHGIAFQSTNTTHIAMMSELTGSSAPSIRRVCALKRASIASSVQDIQIMENRAAYMPEATTIQRDKTSILIEELEVLMAKLKPRNRDIVSTLMADDGDVSSRRIELAERHNVTPERIGQIYRDAIAIIRSALEARGLSSAT